MLANRIFNRAKVRLKKAQKQLWSRPSGPCIESAQRWDLEEFLHHFEIENVRLAHAESGLQAAQDALIEHYAARVQTEWLGCPDLIFDLDLPVARMSQDEIHHHAEKFLRGDLFTNAQQPKHQPNGIPDWRFNPTTDMAWLRRLHRHQWWPLWGQAYAQTKDERYAQAFVDQLTDWIANCPPPARKDERHPQWRLMEVGQRMVVSWIPAFGLFYASPAFTTEAKMRMLRAIYDHARFLSLFQTNRNHLLRESNGLAYVATYFPEFQMAKQWQQVAFERLDQELGEQINQDGTHIEVSTGYQWLVTDEFEDTYDLLQTHGLSLPHEDLAGQLRKMYRVLVHLTRPDGSFPQLNDGFLHWSHEDLATAGSKFGWADLRYVGTQGKEGVAPEKKSIAFENAGLYIMRSEWSQDANYLLFDAGPFGGPHGHEDKLSIEVAAFGQPFLVDSGSFTYDPKNCFRTYFVDSRSHNTVLVDGKSQVRRWTPANLHPQLEEKSDAIWQSTDDFDYVAASYREGYGEYAMRKPAEAKVASDVVHTRRVLFVKPDYWVVIDELSGVEAHEYQLLFHTQPGVTLSTGSEQRTILTSTLGNARLALIPARPELLAREEKMGEEDPVQGWYSAGYNQKQPATTIIYRSPNTSSFLFATLLYPMRADEDAERIRFEPLDVTDRSARAYTITTARGTDTILFSDSAKSVRFGAFESTASVAGVRTGNDGNKLIEFELT